MKLTFALIPIVCISCLPSRLVPHDFSIEKNNAEAYIETDSMALAVTNLEVKGDHMVFGMEIENKSSQPLFLDLNKLTKYAHEQSYRSEHDGKLFQEVTRVMTPRQVNKFFKSKRDNAQSAAFLLFLVGAAVGTYDAIKDERDNRKQQWTQTDEKKSRNRDLITATTLLATDILADAARQTRDVAETELHYLPKEVFDRKVIYPGEIYNGKIFFKRFGRLKKHHRITLPMDGDQFHFDFRKATYKEREFLMRR